MSNAQFRRTEDSSVLDTILSHAFRADEIPLLESLGEFIDVPHGAVLFSKGERSDFLYAVMDGALLPAASSGGMPSFWVGPGDVCGEIGFLLGTARATTMTGFGPAPRVWRIHREALSNVGGAKGAAVTRLLAALARVVHARLEAPKAKPSCWSEADYCDEEHPSVVAMARRHVRATPLATACAIWSTMWAIPYRFGTWQWSASETIARGHGMCTTKAVLQVALMRALGIEAGYVRTEVSGTLARALMPNPYGARFDRPTFKHYYAAARIGERWIPFDSSYSRSALALIAAREAHVLPFVEWNAEKEGYANGVATLSGTDPFAITVHADISDVMKKTPSYDAKNAEAMNIVVDRAQGYVFPAPSYVAAAEEALANGDTTAARNAVMAGLGTDAANLRARGSSTDTR